MKNDRGFTLIELMVVMVVIGILAVVAVSNWMAIQDRARETRVRSNCHTVQLAAEDFSVQNDGVYADNLGATLAGGEVLMDLLPRGANLENPFTRTPTALVVGPAAQVGETGYVGTVDPVTGASIGYSITGQGKHGLILTLTNGS